MTYPFDLEIAINQIATLESAISTPTPGITNSYGYGLNPSSFTDPSTLPAIVHIPRGPAGPRGEAEIFDRSWQLYYDIWSRLLIIEAVPDKYPADEVVANKFWRSVAETFLTDATRNSLVNLTGAFNYVCVFEANSYAVRPWPPVRNAPSAYWSLQYIHRFTVHGG